MAHEFSFPGMGDAETGTIVEWYRRDGDWVTEGEAVVAVDLDKVGADVPVSASGYLSIVAAVDQEVAIGGLLAWILAEGEVAPGER
jgi:pyruvate/2-oxoglutarate dehydrogenase complex dihydrolipoamide acyltransferase (E2) component